MYPGLVLPPSRLDAAPENQLLRPAVAAAAQTARCQPAPPRAALPFFLPVSPIPAMSSPQRNFPSRPIPILPRGNGVRGLPSFPPSGSGQFRASWFHLTQVHCRNDTNEDTRFTLTRKGLTRRCNHSKILPLFRTHLMCASETTFAIPARTRCRAPASRRYPQDDPG